MLAIVFFSQLDEKQQMVRVSILYKLQFMLDVETVRYIRPREKIEESVAVTKRRHDMKAV